jgi:hypothetical protein
LTEKHGDRCPQMTMKDAHRIINGMDQENKMKLNPTPSQQALIEKLYKQLRSPEETWKKPRSMHDADKLIKKLIVEEKESRGASCLQMRRLKRMGVKVGKGVKMNAMEAEEKIRKMARVR